MREGPLGDAAILLYEGPAGVGLTVGRVDAKLLAALAALAARHLIRRAAVCRPGVGVCFDLPACLSV